MSIIYSSLVIWLGDMEKMCVWVDINIPYFSNVTYMIQWIDLHMIVQFKWEILESGFMTLLWGLWYHRNDMVFRKK